MDTYTKNRVNPCNPCLKKVDAYFDTSTYKNLLTLLLKNACIIAHDALR